MKVEFHGPWSPEHHSSGALFTIMAHNAKAKFDPTWAVELALLKFWGWSWKYVGYARFLTFVCGCFGGVILAGGQARLRGRMSEWD